MTEEQAEIAARALREAGHFEAADDVETAARVERESAYTRKWQERWENDTWDLY